MTQSQIAVTLFTLREYTQTPAHIAETLHKVKAIGYGTVQLSALGPVDPLELKSMLDGEGLGVCATHVSLERLQQELDAVINEHKLWGCQNVAIGALSNDWRTAEGYARFAREGSRIARELAAADLTFSYHNHWWEFDQLDGRTGFDILFEESKASLLAEVDVCWAQRGGADPAATIRKLAGRQHIIHFKDMVIKEGQPVTVEVGEGILSWPPIVQACREVGIQWHIVEQDYCQRDPFESIAISLRNLRAMGLS